MSSDLAKSALVISKAIQDEVNQYWLPPADGLPSRQEMVLAKSLVKGTRGYIESVVNQINSTYENASYDACAVMIRRLIETLIIEAFEHHKIADKIKTPGGDFFYLSDLITHTLNEKSWNIGRNAKHVLPKLKSVGDLSAHSRRHIAHRSDIDNIMSDLRTAVQELIYLANLK
ncbi:MAG TPA: DUF4145 domain-containing protein [Methylomirabilota bacterium]|nr:DUF4145 domain-containing protein [Methylomirabilota bacterium]